MAVLLSEVLHRHQLRSPRSRREQRHELGYRVEREIEDIDALLRRSERQCLPVGERRRAPCSRPRRRQPARRRQEGGDLRGALHRRRQPPAARRRMERDRPGESPTAGAATPIKHFLKSAGVPGVIVTLMRLMPMWSKLEVGGAHAPLRRRARAQRTARPYPLQALTAGGPFSVPVLVCDGGKSPAWLRIGNRSLANILANAEYKTVTGQTPGACSRRTCTHRS